MCGGIVSGNPHGMPAMYAAVATDSSGYVGFIRPAIHSTSGDELVNLLRTDTDQKWINSQCVHLLRLYFCLHLNQFVSVIDSVYLLQRLHHRRVIAFICQHVTHLT